MERFPRGWVAATLYLILSLSVLTGCSFGAQLSSLLIDRKYPEKTFGLEFIDPIYRYDIDKISFDFSPLVADPEIKRWRLYLVNKNKVENLVRDFSSEEKFDLALPSNFKEGKIRLKIQDIQGFWSEVSSESFRVYSEVENIFGPVNPKGSVDGIGTLSRLFQPMGMATHGGSIVLADGIFLRSFESVVGSSYEIRTLAGSTFSRIHTGNGEDITFTLASGVASDGTYIYVSDYSRHCIMRINPSPANTLVEEYLGGCDAKGGNTGATTVAKAAAAFNGPMGIKWYAGELYIADSFNHCIKKYNPVAEQVSVVAGTCGSSGAISGLPGTARLNSVRDFDIDQDGNLFLTSSGTRQIAYVTLPSTHVRMLTLAQSVASVSLDGIPNTAMLYPYGVRAYSKNGENILFVSDYQSHIVMGIPYDPSDLSQAAGQAFIVAGILGIKGAKYEEFSSKISSPTYIHIKGDELFISSTYGHGILSVDLNTYRVSHVLGSDVEQTSTALTKAAMIAAPRYMARKGDEILVSAGNAIRAYNVQTQHVRTVVGHSYFTGNVDGHSQDARLSEPWGIFAVDSGFYHVDRVGNTIRFTSNAGQTRTVAGIHGVRGNQNSIIEGNKATFNYPRALCAIGNDLYVIEDERVLRKLEVGDINDPIADPVTIDFAGSRIEAFTDGMGTGAAFFKPRDIACVSSGAHQGIYVSDGLKIRKVALTGQVSTIAGSATGSADGNGSSATFDTLMGIDVIGTHIYAAETNGRIRKISLDAPYTVESIANRNWAKTTLAKRKDIYLVPSNYQDVLVDGDFLYVTSEGAHRISKLSLLKEEAETLVGLTRDDFPGPTNTDGNASPEIHPKKITAQVVVGNKIYSASFFDFAIFETDLSTRQTKVFAGKPHAAGYVDGYRAEARISEVHSIGHYNGALYFPEYLMHTVRKLDLATGMVSTITGTLGDNASPTGLREPYGVAFKGRYMFFTELSGGVINALDLETYEVFTVIGVKGDKQVVDGDKNTARLSNPYGITVLENSIYISESGENILRRVDITDPRNAFIETVAGTAGQFGYVDAAGSAARLFNPTGLATDGRYIYFTERGTNSIRRYDPRNHEVRLWLGNPRMAGVIGGSLKNTKMLLPISISITSERFCFSDGSHGNIRCLK